MDFLRVFCVPEVPMLLLSLVMIYSCLKLLIACGLISCLEWFNTWLCSLLVKSTRTPYRLWALNFSNFMRKWKTDQKSNSAIFQFPVVLFSRKFIHKITTIGIGQITHHIFCFMALQGIRQLLSLADTGKNFKI